MTREVSRVPQAYRENAAELRTGSFMPREND
jgi:hypothetical protein